MPGTVAAAVDRIFFRLFMWRGQTVKKTFISAETIESIITAKTHFTNFSRNEFYNILAKETN